MITLMRYGRNSRDENECDMPICSLVRKLVAARKLDKIHNCMLDKKVMKWLIEVWKKSNLNT